MNRKTIIIVASVFVAILICGYAAYDNIFPMASPIQCPSIENTVSVTVSSDDMQYDKSFETDFEKIIMHIADAKPTRKMSVNDYPTVRPYYQIELKTVDKTFRYFVYEENNNVYIEVPYEGIYIADSQIMYLIREV